MYFVVYEPMCATNGIDLFGPFSTEEAAINWALSKKFTEDKGGWDGKFTITEAVNPTDILDECAEMEYDWPTPKTIS